MTRWTVIGEEPADLRAMKSVLDLEAEPQEPLAGQTVRFSAPLDGDWASKRTVTFSAEDWDAMGGPRQVTVEILPGDTLNEP